MREVGRRSTDRMIARRSTAKSGESSGGTPTPPLPGLCGTDSDRLIMPEGTRDDRDGPAQSFIRDARGRAEQLVEVSGIAPSRAIASAAVASLAAIVEVRSRPGLAAS